MNTKEKRRSRCTRPKSGRDKWKSNPLIPIVWQSGFPVNGIFSCGFVRDVFQMLSYPVTIEQIADQTESREDRVCLAIHDLRASGVTIGGAT